MSFRNLLPDATEEEIEELHDSLPRVIIPDAEDAASITMQQVTPTADWWPKLFGSFFRSPKKKFWVYSLLHFLIIGVSYMLPIKEIQDKYFPHFPTLLRSLEVEEDVYKEMEDRYDAEYQEYGE